MEFLALTTRVKGLALQRLFKDVKLLTGEAGSNKKGETGNGGNTGAVGLDLGGGEAFNRRAERGGVFLEELKRDLEGHPHAEKRGRTHGSRTGTGESDLLELEGEGDGANRD